MLQNFNEPEKMHSSTWRELQAISHSLNSMMKYFKNKYLYWQTDKVATISIIGSGSNKVMLQNLAL